ncbi:MAG: ECF transporter S component [Clostridiales bacterium]|nr:ECF transporter S component [Clostridiales bacterium]
MKITTRRLVIIGVLGAISIVLGLTPLGIIPIPFSPTRATIMHIPVIIASIVEGPIVGLFVALIFAGTSMYQAVTNPTPVSFVFLDPLVAIMPRLLIALTSYYSYRAIERLLSKKDNRLRVRVGSGVSAAIGTFTNTVGVLSAIYIRHGAAYGEKLGVGAHGTGALLMGIAVTHGIPEIIVAVLIITAVVSALKRMHARQS